MPQPPDVTFTAGDDAAAEIADDPFWSAVHRRHPDVDLVVLPQEEPGRVAVPADEPVLSRDQATELCDEAVAAWWRAVQPDDEPERTADRWLAGEAPGTVRHEATWTRDGVDPVAAAAALSHLARLLDEGGWRSFSPPDGLPRVLASRAGRLGQAELQLVHDPRTTRLVLRLRSDLLHVGTETAGDMTGAAS